MDKIERGNPLTQSADIVKENLEILKQLFPTIVKEGKIDVDELKALIDDEVETSEEYYRFTWAGKSESRLEANKPSTGTLRPNKADSKNWDTTGNIFIEGDNLEVLKLMQKSYVGKFKMIYFDPPYNTGNDFVYKDNYSDNLKNYLVLSGQTDEEGNKTSTNAESDGRYHSNWLNMLYPRLKLARNLLDENGVIFISIDDNEVHNLRKLSDEIFGEENFVAQFVWIKKKKGSHLSKTTRSMTEYVLSYSKSPNKIELFGENAYGDKQQPLAKRTNAKKDLCFPNNIVKTTLKDGFYKSGIYGEGTSSLHFLQDFLVKDNLVVTELLVNGPFIWTQPKLDSELELGSTVNLSSKFGFNVLRSDQDEKIKRPSTLIDSKVNVGTNEDAYDEGIELFKKEGIMSYPKPTSLIKFLINTITFFDNNAYILDFFAGSGTTAHSVMQLNSEDGGDRKYVLIQLPEQTDIKSEAYKAGFKNIADICKERIRISGNKIISAKADELNKLKISIEGKFLQEDIQSQIETIQTIIDKLDIGFKAFKLDSSNIQSWDGSVENFEANLFNAQNNIKDDRTEEDVLYEILLKYGLDLTVPIQEKAVGKCKLYSIGAGVLFICLSENISTEVAKAIGEWKKVLEPATCRVLFKDNGFIDDVAKTNSVQILRQYGIEECNSI